MSEVQVSVKVLITGSRQASPAMLAKAREVVAWCQAEGYVALVGEAPGIDHTVRVECSRRRVPVTVFGAYDRIREPELGATWEARVLLSGSYPARDRVMARHCDWCVAIWNGKSSGTKLTYEAVEALGKRVWRRVFPD
jgi:hypothetical protein